MYQDNFYIETSSTAPGSAVASFQEVGDNPERLAQEYAQRRANASGAESSAVVYDSEQELAASAWATPKAANSPAGAGARGERGSRRPRGAAH